MLLMIEKHFHLASYEKADELVLRKKPVQRKSDGSGRKDRGIRNHPLIGILTDDAEMPSGKAVLIDGSHQIFDIRCKIVVCLMDLRLGRLSSEYKCIARGEFLFRTQDQVAERLVTDALMKWFSDYA